MTKLLIKMFLKNSDIKSVSGRENYGKLAGIVGIICNLFLSVLKLIVGSLSNSVAITADAINNVSDAGSSIITLVGFRLSGKPADEDHPYGHARMEYISGLIVSFLILLIGVEILKTSVQKIITPEEIVFSWISIVVLSISIFVKLWMSLFNKTLGKKINSTALEATAADSRNDVITTLAVLVATVLSNYINFNFDGFMGVIVAIFILVSGVKLVKETMDPLLGQAPSKQIYDEIEEKMLSYENILGVHDLMVHSYGPGCYFASAHVEMDAKLNVLICHDIMDKMERDFLNDLNIHLVVHLDPTVLDSEETNELKALVGEILNEIDSDITFHDFRVVFGQEVKNVLFDVVVPPKYKMKDDELEALIKRKINEAGEGKLFAVILVDHSYGTLKDE